MDASRVRGDYLLRRIEMKVYVVIGENRRMHNISAHAAFTTRTAAEKWAKDPKENWLSDRWAINEVELDLEVVTGKIPKS